MKLRKIWIATVIAVALACSVQVVLAAGDWPQWRGSDRKGLSSETGLLQSWPEEGPRKIWSIENLGSGYGSVSVQGDRIFVQGTRGSKSALICLELESGRTIWSHLLGASLEESRGGGPRGTPTIDNERVYALSENGDLACVKFQDGSLIWQRNILEDFGGRNPKWLISESPLVDGAKLIVTPGGDEASIVALDKMTGETIWTSEGLSDQAGYSSCIAADIEGIRIIMAFTSQAAVGLRASDGELMWRYRNVANRTANVATPVFQDNKVFYTSAYRTGAALLELEAEGERVSAREVYFSRDMQNHHGGVVLVDGFIYGFSGSVLTCVNFETGKRVWRDRSVGKGSLTYAEGHLYLLGEDNVVGMAEATPAGYVEKGRFSIEDQGRPSWAHPVVSNGRLYIRNQGTLTAYLIKLP
jgi:outer membrane protein assembly factor BamB